MSRALRFSLQMVFATLISRVLGLVRDMLFAHQFGSSPEYDAYLVAILLPFMLRRVFAEGALSTTFVPLYNRRFQENPAAARRFANTVLTLFIPIILLIVILAMYGIPWIIQLFAPGLSPATADLTAFLGRLVFPFILFISLASIYTGMLNSHDHYFGPALSPAIHNIFTIIGIFLAPLFNPPILGPTIFFLLGGVVQWGWVFLLSRRKTHFRLSIGLDPRDIQEFFPVFFTSFAALSLGQINTIVDTNVVSGLGQGSIALLQYANRLFQLPLGVFAISVSTVALSMISKEKVGGASKALAESVEKMFLMILPASLGLLLLREDLVRLLFQRGAFTLLDTLVTSRILLGYVIGLPFYSFLSLFTRAAYSLQMKKVPLVASGVAVGVNVVLDIVLSRVWAEFGVALATSIAGFVGMSILGFVLWKGKYLRVPRAQGIEILKSFVATALMGGVLLFLNSWLHYSALNVGAKVIAGGALFLGALLLMRQKDTLRAWKHLRSSGK